MHKFLRALVKQQRDEDRRREEEHRFDVSDEKGNKRIIKYFASGVWRNAGVFRRF